MKYDLILFDMDGVMTGELYYWKAAAMTVWEYLYGDSPKTMMQKSEEIFDTVFCHRSIIRYGKRAGINTNYDLAFVVTALAKGLLHEAHPFERVKEFFEQEQRQVPVLYDTCAKTAGKGWEHQGTVWKELQNIFQSWYLGDGKEKQGFITQEQPLFPVVQLKELLQAFHSAGITCGIGTGRPKQEIIPHLKRWELYELFDENRIVTLDEVVNAQKELQLSQSLSKPHFYMFGKGVAGLSCNDRDVINKNFDQELVKKTLVVGDAGADIFAARDLGADFAAVLTGVNGKEEKPFFEQLHAEYIFDNVFGLMELL